MLTLTTQWRSAFVGFLHCQLAFPPVSVCSLWRKPLHAVHTYRVGATLPSSRGSSDINYLGFFCTEDWNHSLRICYQPKGVESWGRNVPRPGMALLTFREKGGHTTQGEGREEGERGWPSPFVTGTERGVACS